MMLPFTALFRSRSKHPRDLIKSLVDSLLRLEAGDAKVIEKARQTCTKCLAAIKTLLTPPDNPRTLYGAGEGDGCRLPLVCRW